MNIKETIKEQSDLAIERGHSFKGYFGIDVNEFSKEELIMLLNISFDNIQELRYELKETEKRLIYGRPNY